VDYLFGQVSIDKPFVDWSGNCGNLSAAVGRSPSANGLVDPARVPRDGIARRAHLAGQHRQDHHRPCADHQRPGAGNRRFRARRRDLPRRRSQLEFMDPADDGEGAGGAMFPTGNLVDTLDVPGVGMLRSDDDQCRHPDRVRRTPPTSATPAPSCRTHQRRSALAKFETIRAHGALRMGLIKHLGRSRQAPAHAEDGLRRAAGELRVVQRQAMKPGDVDLLVRACRWASCTTR
jgi:2-methylaconitate cis-trans-isomerase PrpF